MNDPTASQEKRQVHELVEKILRQMEPNPRERALNRLLFRLYFCDAYSIPQIARLRAIALSRSSVARRLEQIRKALQESEWNRRFPSHTNPTRIIARSIVRKRRARKK